MLHVFKALLFKEFASVSPQRSCKSSVIALGWITLLQKEANYNSNIYKTENKRIIEYQSLFYQITVLSTYQRMADAAAKILFEMWENKTIFEETMHAIFEMEATSNTTLILILMIQFDSKCNQPSMLESYKSKITEYFVKSMISSKNKPDKCIIKACRPLLESLTQTEFDTIILPPLQRSILRSPENVLESIGLIFDMVNFDCSRYAEKMGNVLIKNLYSISDIARHESLESLKLMSLKCSDWIIIKGLLENIFSVLNGSDGKISVVEYRLNILQVKLHKIYIYFFYPLLLIILGGNTQLKFSIKIRFSFRNVNLFEFVYLSKT